jgi:hypothetical protein
LKFKSSGEQLLAIFGGWVGDDLAGLAGGSIYREQERRPGILTVTRGGQRKKKSTGARESVASIVAVTPASHEEAQGFTVMRWRAQVCGTWPEGGGSPASLSAQVVEQGGVRR